MSKALAVLAACIDVRSGKRFARGEVFEPVPDPEQAKRLINAGCLPEAALEAAIAAEDAAEKKAKEEAEALAKAEAAEKAKADAAAKTAEKKG